MTIEQKLDRLNEYQRAAVFHEGRACLVNASVGSGKTTVLVTKVQYLHEVKQIPLTDMLVLTFTNKAANEIMERLNVEDEPLIGTFHSVALWLLRNRFVTGIEEMGFTRDFLVIEPEEEIDIALFLIAEHKLTIKYKNRLKKRLEQAMQITEESRKVSKYQDDIFVLVQLLQEEKKKQNKMSFHDLLTYACILQQKQQEYPAYIIVDEVQDCDTCQIAFLKQFMGEETRLFAVGDPNQVIYSWRGGGVNLFYQMKHTFQAEEISLPINYRSCTSILEAAKCFLQTGDPLVGNREQGANIVIRKYYDPFQNASDMATRIQKLHEEGVPYSEIAIFYRLQSQSEIFEHVFDREGIPYEVSMKKTIRDIPVLNWFLKVLRYAVNPKDVTSQMLALTDKAYGCGLTENKLRKLIREGKTLPVLQQKMEDFSTTSVLQTLQTREAFYEYFDFASCLHPTSASYEEECQAIRSFIDILFSYMEESGVNVPDMISFLNSSALSGLQILQKDMAQNQETVKLMTLHASKGLEFSRVFITGVNYGLIPLQSKNEEMEEEERRLFFVGITRARDYLELSYYTNPGTFRAMPGPSRYLTMIPKRLIESEDVMSEKESSEQTDIFQLQNLRKQVQIAKIKKQLEHSVIDQVLGMPTTEMPTTDIQNKEMIRNKGMNPQGSQGMKMTQEGAVPQIVAEQAQAENQRRVSHEKYGVGKVTREDEMMITVVFEHYGEKEFVKQFTKLTELG